MRVYAPKRQNSSAALTENSYLTTSPQVGCWKNRRFRLQPQTGRPRAEIRRAGPGGRLVLVPAEMLGVSAGLRYFILDTRDRPAYSKLMAAIILIGCRDEVRPHPHLRTARQHRRRRKPTKREALLLWLVSTPVCTIWDNGIML
jgi:hypothetical protein